jgi:hypothetical protein
MPINQFKRISNYFTTKDKIEANSIDSQFNLIGEYINKTVKPILDQLSKDSVPGSINPADVNKYYQNVGDGTTKWSAITNDVFVDNSLTLQKIDKNNVGSIIAADNQGAFNVLTPTSDNQVLVSRNNNTPIWKKLTGDNMLDRGLTGVSIAQKTITNQNLPAYLLQTQIADNSLVATKFHQNVITTAKLGKAADGDGLTINKLTLALEADFTDKLWENIMPDNFLAPMTYNDWNRIISIEGMSGTDVARLAPWISYDPYSYDGNILPQYFLPIAKLNVPTLDNKREGFKSEHIAANSIDGKRLWYRTQYAFSNNAISFVADGSIGPEHLTPQLRAALGF